MPEHWATVRLSMRALTEMHRTWQPELDKTKVYIFVRKIISMAFKIRITTKTQQIIRVDEAVDVVRWSAARRLEAGGAHALEPTTASHVTCVTRGRDQRATLEATSLVPFASASLLCSLTTAPVLGDNGGASEYQRSSSTGPQEA